MQELLPVWPVWSKRGSDDFAHTGRAAVHGGPYKISAERAGKYTTIYKEGFMLKTHRSAPLVLAALLTSCASIPNGPSVMALPGSGRTFDQFREDDASCKLYASEQVEGRTPNDAAILSGVGTAALITALGAAAGAIFGGGSGAAIGAGGGLLVGGLMGTSSATASGNIGQQRYDIAYTQCMYGKGNHVPLSGQIMDGNRNPSQGTPLQPQSGPSIPPPPPPSNIPMS